jgi:beta-galactosidase
MTETADALTFKARDFSVTFDKTGTFRDYVYKGTRLVERGPLPDFWRAPTDNDRGALKNLPPAERDKPDRNPAVWREAGWQPGPWKVERPDHNAAVVRYRGPLAAGGQYELVYRIDGLGDITVEAAYTPGEKRLAMMPRFGTELVLAPGLENLRWYGRGPVETYIDRNFERVGLYSSTVDAEWVEYSRPQENGNKVDVRWATLTNKAGVGLRATGLPVLGVRATHFSKKSVEEMDYSFKLERRPEIYLNLDWKQMGVGGIDSWSPNAWPMQPYRIPPDQAYKYSYRLSPVVVK